VGRRRQLLFDIGAKLPRSIVRSALAVTSSLEMGRWLTDTGFQCNQFYRDKAELFAAIAQQVSSKQVLYLEFGVYSGDSMRMWSKLLKDPRSVLHGFDSFLGLPEYFECDDGYQKGAFSTGGVMPQIDDPRVKFFKGWFDEVLPSYSPPEHEVMIVNDDADLYSSTMLVLNKLQPTFRPGDYLYFDEFSIPLHEASAFRSFLERTGMKFRLFGAARGYSCAAFRCERIKD
jgi:hypothetical protein